VSTSATTTHKTRSQLQSRGCAHIAPAESPVRTQVSAKLLHRRLGHVHADSAKKTVKATDGLVLDPISERKCLCEVCVMAKMHKLPFRGDSAEHPEATRPGFRIHSDVCGPLRTATHGGKRYFVSFIDDKTNHVTIYLMTNKSEVFDKIKEFHAWLVNIMQQQIAYFKFDGGGEFASNELLAWLKAKGIKLEVTCPYTPSQNPKAERMNRTIMEMARAMLFESGLSDSYWGEAVLTAAHIRNRVLGSSAQSGITPLEAMLGTKPNLGLLRVFGCAAYAHVPDQLRHKLQPKARKCVLLGFADEQRGYRLLNVATRKIIYCKDVVFDENLFPALKAKLARDPALESPAESIEKSEAEDDDSVLTDPGDDHKSVPEGPPSSVRRSGRQQVPSQQFLDAVANARLARESESSDDTFEMAYRVNVVEGGFEPTYRQAMAGPDQVRWLDGIEAEVKSLLENKTWEWWSGPGPPPKQPLRSKFVLKAKRDDAGNITRWKARLVALGFLQRRGIDYGETFAPVVRMASLRVFLALVAAQNLELKHLDVDTAFLNGVLDEEVYMRLPEHFDEKGVPVIVRLLKSIYGLKQASRAWNKAMHAVLIVFGFVQSKADPCIYVFELGAAFLAMAVYVDDFFVAFNDEAVFEALKSHLEKHFRIKDLGDLRWALGIRVTRDRQARTLSLDQEQYLSDMLKTFRMDQCVPVDTPEQPGLLLTKAMSPADDVARQHMSSIPYRSAVGKLMYPMLCTRPDLAHAVRQASKFLESPGLEHWAHVKRMFRYIKGSVGRKLTYHGGKERVLKLECYADADWANSVDDRKSVTAVLPFLCSAPVSWLSKGQATVALSSTEAEYMAVSEAVREVSWLRQLLSDLKCVQHEPTVIWEDNLQTILLASDPLHHARNKHIDVRHHYVRDKVTDGQVVLRHCPTGEMVADMFTKPLPRVVFTGLLKKLFV
jgi:hypothetical protein